MTASPLLLHNVAGLTGATADGGTWQISDGILRLPPS
jgi:hypothetical protein